MPSNQTLVCANCRTSARHPSGATCTTCRGYMTPLGKKYRIPPKRDKKAWAELKRVLDKARDRV